MDAEVVALLDRGADVHAPDCHGRSALFIAAGLAGMVAVQAVLAKGADVNEVQLENRVTPLVAAVEAGRADVAAALLAAGAEVGIVDVHGDGILRWAFVAPTEDVAVSTMEVLVGAGADTTTVVNVDGGAVGLCARLGARIYRPPQRGCRRGGRHQRHWRDRRCGGGEQPPADHPRAAGGGRACRRGRQCGPVGAFWRCLTGPRRGRRGAPRRSRQRRAATRRWHDAAYNGGAGGAPPVVRLLVETGVETGVTSTCGDSAVEAALRNGHEDIFDLLLPTLADVAAVRSRTGRALLFDAAADARVHFVAALLGAGVDPNQTDERGVTPLMFAARGGHVANVRALLAAGADASAANTTGLTALFFAAFKDSADAVTALAAAPGVDVNVKCHSGRTAIFEAVGAGAVAAITALLSAGADASLPNNPGDVLPLHFAAQLGDVAAIAALTAAHANVDAACARGDAPLLRGSLRPPRRGAGAPRRRRRRGGGGHQRTSALSHAAAQDATAALRVLLDAGADVGAADANGETPIFRAAHGGAAAAARLLLAASPAAAVAANPTGWTPTHQAGRGRAWRRRGAHRSPRRGRGRGCGDCRRRDARARGGLARPRRGGGDAPRCGRVGGVVVAPAMGGGPRCTRRPTRGTWP
ncbi:hypothetical protein BU14_0929s0002 [Porphyra umbilicalis]|uniref:Uncharacterized protein n=1 Tax=Porphyra umbilicalis TaxID=2786 RepID=A0A1X6NNB9_PORUM|nr:hypothetical protein BU14_0929s0002 [Porphyra umbilicalis]|eukprot:OSX70077.1 hypothetical protein BU14_0929s0002 [Porphyra umbilicalis]